MECDYDKGYINLSSTIKVLSEYSTIGAYGGKHSSMYTNTDRQYFEGNRHALVKKKYVIVYVMQ